MAILSEAEILALSDTALIDQEVLITRGKSSSTFRLLEVYGHGNKGLVWKGSDDIGNLVAVKFIPNREYEGVSMSDEMSKAQKLGSKYFADTIFFGEVLEPISLKNLQLQSIVTKWIEGLPFEAYVEKRLASVGQFITLAEAIFQALATLKAHNLCHDDLHPGNILIERNSDYLNDEEFDCVKIIDTGTLKSEVRRDFLLNKLRESIKLLEQSGANADSIVELKDRLKWKEPNDHLRAISCLVVAANGLIRNYHKLSFWERRFIDSLTTFFENTTDESLDRRIQSPDRVMSALYTIEQDSKKADQPEEKFLRTPFDYPSSEMIRDDREFSTLFSNECPWLEQSKDIRSFYIYGPRGSGKSSVLRWLSFKTFIAGINKEKDFGSLHEVGIYVSCSVELRSRFWLLNDLSIDKMEKEIIKFFNFLLLEELFDTLARMIKLQSNDAYNFGFSTDKMTDFTKWVLKRCDAPHDYVRLEGQDHFEYLKMTIRKLKWETWSRIQKAETVEGISDPSLVTDICKEIGNSFDYFKKRFITFLLDDYSNQRIPAYLQKKLNKTISFAKQAMPIFKVTSEYNGVDLEGIDRSREVSEINIGERYTSLESEGTAFIANILNKRLENTNPKYIMKIDSILGRTKYKPDEMANAIANEKSENGEVFYYSGLDCIHWICSGDIALVLELVKRIFDKGGVSYNTNSEVSESIQHKAIQQFSHEEVKRLRYIVPDGDKIYEIVFRLGLLAHTIVKNKQSNKADRSPSALCKTHLDIKGELISKLEKESKELYEIFSVLNSKAILFSLTESRARSTGQTARFQIRRIYLPAFKAPLKRDEAIRIENIDELKSLLSDPNLFCRRQLTSSGVLELNYDQAIEQSQVKAIGIS